MELGIDDGSDVGTTDGLELGSSDGLDEGILDGEVLGSEEGFEDVDGSVDGDELGI